MANDPNGTILYLGPGRAIFESDAQLVLEDSHHFFRLINIFIISILEVLQIIA